MTRTEVPQDLTTAMPAQIDAALANLWGQADQAQAQIDVATKRLDQIRNKTQSVWSEWEQTLFAKLPATIDAAQDAWDTLAEQINPLQLEFLRRGGWTRAWIVLNSNGHVHNSRACHTCYATTSFAWLPEVSGLDEDEIIRLAGKNACTVCYPNAPVEYRCLPSQLEEPEKKAKRLEREAVAQAKAEKAAITGILNADGTAVRGEYGIIKTERTAATEAGQIVWAAIVYRDYNPPSTKDREVFWRIVRALAHKRGASESDVWLDIITKQLKKTKNLDWTPADVLARLKETV